jgi:hypothetical protein
VIRTKTTRADLQALNAAAAVVGVDLLEVRVEVALRGQRLAADGARHLHVEVQPLLVRLHVRLVVCLELERLGSIL